MEMGTYHLNHLRGVYIIDLKKMRPHAWYKRRTETMSNLDTVEVKSRSKLARVTTTDPAERS